MPPKKRTYDDRSEDYTRWTTRKLRKAWKDESKYIDDGCFGVSNLVWCQRYAIELDKRER